MSKYPVINSLIQSQGPIFTGMDFGELENRVMVTIVVDALVDLRWDESCSRQDQVACLIKTHQGKYLAATGQGYVSCPSAAKEFPSAKIAEGYRGVGEEVVPKWREII